MSNIVITNLQSIDGIYQSATDYLGRINVSSDYGQTWTPIDTNTIMLEWKSISVSSSGKYQTAVEINGIYVSSNYGNTWTYKDYNRNWSRVSISSSGKYQTAVQRIGFIYVSSDYGQNWNPKSTDSNRREWFDVSVSSSGRYQTACDRNSGYIYISSDYGETWTPKDSNRSWRSVSVSSNGQYQTSCVENGQIYISSDYGNTWIPKDSNRDWRNVSVSSTGQYQTACVDIGNIYTSSDYGINWTPKVTDSIIRWSDVSISSSGKYQTACVYGGYIYVSSDYGQTWTPKITDSDRNWSSVSVNKALPTCKDNTNVFFILKDVDDIVPYNDGTNTYDLMNVVKNNNLYWNTVNTSGQYKIIVSFSEPVNIKKIYFKCTNTNDEGHSATSLVVYPNIYIGNSTNPNVAPIKMNPEPTSILTLNNINTNVANNYNYYISNPVVNTDTNLYTDYTLVFNKTSPNQMFLSYLNFDINNTLTPPEQSGTVPSGTGPSGTGSETGQSATGPSGTGSETGQSGTGSGTVKNPDLNTPKDKILGLEKNVFYGVLAGTLILLLIVIGFVLSRRSK